MSQQQPPSIDDIRKAVSQMLDRLDPDTAIGATVVFRVNPGKLSTFLRNAETLAQATRKLGGCNIFVYQRQEPVGPEPENYRQYLIYENWDTVRQFRVQWNSQHIKDFQYSIGELVVAPPDLNFYFGWRESKADIRVLKTGQTRCWDSKGDRIECAGSGRDGAIQAGAPIPAPRFTDNGDGTVTDKLTDLIWLKNANRFGEMPWEQALATANKLAAGSAGLNDGSSAGDWRLPNVLEMESLSFLDNDTGPAIPPDNPFTNLQAANYWTSSSVAVAPALGWFVALAVAPHVFDLKMNAMRVWPVRGGGNPRLPRTGQTGCFDTWGRPVPCEGTGQDGAIRSGVPFPEPRFIDNANGTVSDKLTGLVWLKNANRFGTRSWEQALKDCNNLGGGGHELTDGSAAGDWRLPNLNELRSLIDFGKFAPSLSAGHPFNNVRTSLYWSSTTIASAPNQARFVFVGIGPSVWDHKSVRMGVWPVRGGVMS